VDIDYTCAVRCRGMDGATEWDAWKARFRGTHAWTGEPLAGEMVSTTPGSRVEYIAFAEGDGIATDLRIFEPDGVERPWAPSTGELRASLLALRRSLRERLALGELADQEAIVVRVVLVGGALAHLDHGCYEARAWSTARPARELARLMIDDLEHRLDELGWPVPGLR
jgi:hypothetical protein